MANIIISSVAISTRSPSFVAHSPVTDYIAFWGERSRLSPPEYPPLRWAGAGYTWLPECAAQCPARALPHAVLMMPVPSPAPAQPSNIPTISYISAALQPAACSLQPPVANFLCRYLINAFGQYYFGWERAVKLPHFPSTLPGIHFISFTILNVRNPMQAMSHWMLGESEIKYLLTRLIIC